jgi:hypothetical protein
LQGGSGAAAGDREADVEVEEIGQVAGRRKRATPSTGEYTRGTGLWIRIGFNYYNLIHLDWEKYNIIFEFHWGI